jgi:ribulose 1,5-bisphosphate synthetase/thiazole synthase
MQPSPLGHVFVAIIIVSPRQRIMSIFEIRQKSNGAILWTGSACDATSALDAMAREAGYVDFASLPEDIRAADPVARPID